MDTQKLQFNEHGLLLPAEAIQSDLGTIEQYFVTAFPRSKTRQKLFENLMEFNQKLQSDVFPWYVQWVNGSFVTMKENPMDIDVVTFFDSEVYVLRERKLDFFMAENFEKYGLDTYFVPVFTVGQPEFEQYQRHSKYWFNLFTNSSYDGGKGFLKLNFGRKT